MTSALLLPDHRPMRAESIVDAPSVKGIVDNPVARHLQCLDGQVEISSKYPIALGGNADIYAGILRGGLDLLGPRGWAGKAVDGRDIAVGTVHVYTVPPPDSGTTLCIKVAVKVFRNAHNRIGTKQKYLKVSQ